MPFGLSQTVAIWLLAALLGVAALGGWKTRDAFCDAAEAKALLAGEILKRQKAELELKGYKDSSAVGVKAIAILNDLKEKQDASRQELLDYLSKQPAGSVCVFSDDIVRRLLAIAR